MIKIYLSDNDLAIIRKYVPGACLGGRSHIRMQTDRKKKLEDDQFVGLAGVAAFCKWMYGNLDLFEETRKEADKHRWNGDGGSDLLGLAIDIKTSRMRAGPDYPYHLYIREAEYHPKTCYILALMPPDKDNWCNLCGFCDGLFLPDPTPSADGWGPRRSLRIDELNPMEILRGELEVRE